MVTINSLVIPTRCRRCVRAKHSKSEARVKEREREREWEREKAQIVRITIWKSSKCLGWGTRAEKAEPSRVKAEVSVSKSSKTSVEASRGSSSKWQIAMMNCDHGPWMWLHAPPPYIDLPSGRRVAFLIVRTEFGRTMEAEDGQWQGSEFEGRSCLKVKSRDVWRCAIKSMLYSDEERVCTEKVTENMNEERMFGVWKRRKMTGRRWCNCLEMYRFALVIHVWWVHVSHIRGDLCRRRYTKEGVRWRSVSRMYRCASQLLHLKWLSCRSFVFKIKSIVNENLIT
jgi:hypothetical protein